jgi:hypothetical protein
MQRQNYWPRGVSKGMMDEQRNTAPYPAALAVNKYEHLASRSVMRLLLSLFHQDTSEALLSFDQVQQLLRNKTEVDRGTQLIPIDSIVGSVGRYRDFDRAFLPLSGANQERWQRLDIALNELQSIPPIDVYKLGEVYFVRDGNHRVSVAKANDLTHIEANVKEIETVVPLTPDINVDDLIIKLEYAEFQKVTHLDTTRQGQEIRLTEPGRYRILLEHVEVHRYYLGLEWHRTVSIEEAAADWYDNVYLPVVEAIRSTGVLEEFPNRTEADLYLWVAYHRERLRERYGVMPADAEVAAVLKDRFSGRPLGRLIKTIQRALRAARRAAAESPEPPLDQTLPETPVHARHGGPVL